MAERRLKETDVLCYSAYKRSNGTVRRYYAKWRGRHGLAEQCDIPTCIFHTNQLQWNGQPLLLILDHRDGNHKNNSPENLRYLCPNCNSQQPTHGGKNRGRIQNETEFGYEVAHADGHRDANVFPPSLGLSMGLGDATAHAEKRTTHNLRQGED